MLRIILLLFLLSMSADVEPAQLEGTWKSGSKEYTFEAGRYRIVKGTVAEFGTYQIIDTSELMVEVRFAERPSLGDPPTQFQFKIEFLPDFKSFRIGDRVYTKGPPVPIPEW